MWKDIQTLAGQKCRFFLFIICWFLKPHQKPTTDNLLCKYVVQNQHTQTYTEREVIPGPQVSTVYGYTADIGSQVDFHVIW